jgi:glucosamine-6-phosphate deaminase
VALDEQTVSDNSRFFESSKDVPMFALSMGVGTILEAKEIVFLATGAKKADVVAEALEGPITGMVTASALQMHPRVTAIIDEDASDSLLKGSFYRFAADAGRKINKKLF